MKKIFTSIIIISLASCATKSLGIIGKWQTKPEKNPVITAVFKRDNSYEGYVNKKMFTKEHTVLKTRL